MTGYNAGMMRLVQAADKGGDGARFVAARAADDRLYRLRSATMVWALALESAESGRRLRDIINDAVGDEISEEWLLAECRLLPPLDHPYPERMMVSGTGLTHMGSAQTRDSMHTAAIGGAAAIDRAHHLPSAGASGKFGDSFSATEGETQKTPKSPPAHDQVMQGQTRAAASSPPMAVTDSMKMFQLGVAGGKPRAGEFFGAQPEWFYKGDGGCVVAPGGDLELPDYADDGGEEPEVVGLYIIDRRGQPRRIGFALGNEYSDHVMEKKNYLYLAHSKLRQCAMGPEILLGELPAAVSGVSALRRGGETVWQREFYSGEEHMCHSIANLERHHFKYRAFCAAGTAHAHFFGTATLSFADGVVARDGDEFVIRSGQFGLPLVNRLRKMAAVARDVAPL